MNIIAILLIVGVFAFLGKLVSIVYEVIGMDFNFDLLWLDNDIQPDQTEKQVAPDLSDAQLKKEIEELDGILMYQE